VTDTVHQLTRQTVVIGKCKQQQWEFVSLSLLSANWF
jgi:hypothetical protein